MSLASQNLFTNSNPRIAWCSLKNNPLLKNPNFILSLPPTSSAKPPHFKFLKTQSLIHHKLQSFRINHSSLNASFESDKRYGADGLDLDTFLSVSEFLCLASSAVISVGVVLNSSFSSSQKPFLEWLGNRVFVWQSVLLVSGIVIGAVIRRRQWWRICAGFAKAGGSGVNLVGRIEKLEDDLRSSATIIRLLSRQLEKLGIRFRVTRKALKEPIAETAALAQKNSEATRALAAQEDILEKELGEIQRVLLAMQDQQEKQLELILAIAKAGKLWETKKITSQDQNKNETINFTGEEEVKLNATDQIQTLA